MVPSPFLRDIWEQYRNLMVRYWLIIGSMGRVHKRIPLKTRSSFSIFSRRRQQCGRVLKHNNTIHHWVVFTPLILPWWLLCNASITHPVHACSHSLCKVNHLSLTVTSQSTTSLTCLYLLRYAYRYLIYSLLTSLCVLTMLARINYYAHSSYRPMHPPLHVNTVLLLYSLS